MVAERGHPIYRTARFLKVNDQELRNEIFRSDSERNSSCFPFLLSRSFVVLNKEEA
jgi:hypothetical protein